MKKSAQSLFNFLRSLWDENKQELGCIALFFISWRVFHTSISDPFANYDDQDYVSANGHVRSGLSVTNILWAFSGSISANWHPVTMISLMIDSQLYGQHPWGYHLTNVIIHSFNCVFVFLLMRRATGEFWASYLVALLFGLHPLRVESVVWISERKDVLSMLFWLLAASTYVKYAKEIQIDIEKAKRHYMLSLVWFLLGLMSKPMLVTLPCLLLLLDYWPLERWKDEKAWDLIREKWAFFLLSCAFSAITFFTQGPGMMSTDYLPISVRLENVPVAYCRYLGKIFYPHRLSIFYPYPIHWPITNVIGSFLLLCIISIYVWKVRIRRPYMFVGWLWFLGVLFPVIGVTQAGSQSMADRYSYMPSIGVLIMLIWYFRHFCIGRRISVAFLRIAAVGAVVICCVLTRIQMSYWRSAESLWNHAVAVTELNYVGYALVGLNYLSKSNYSGAITNLQNAIRIKDDIEHTHLGLGIALNRTGRSKDALMTLEKAIWMEPTNAEAYKEMALALIATDRRAEALTNLDYAIKLQPNYEEAKGELHKLTNLPARGSVEASGIVK